MIESELLIDTSAWIWAFRPMCPPALRERIHAILAEDAASTTPIILLEISCGARDVKHYWELMQEFTSLHQLAITKSIWERSYQLAFKL